MPSSDLFKTLHNTTTAGLALGLNFQPEDEMRCSEHLYNVPCLVLPRPSWNNISSSDHLSGVRTEQVAGGAKAGT